MLGGGDQDILAGVSWPPPETDLHGENLADKRQSLAILLKVQNYIANSIIFKHIISWTNYVRGWGPRYPGLKLTDIIKKSVFHLNGYFFQYY